MSELEKLTVLLDELQIAYELVGECIALSTKPVFIREESDGLQMVGFGYHGVFQYSAAFIARALDRKFKQEMCVGCRCSNSCRAAKGRW